MNADNYDFFEVSKNRTLEQTASLRRLAKSESCSREDQAHIEGLSVMIEASLWMDFEPLLRFFSNKRDMVQMMVRKLRTMTAEKARFLLPVDHFRIRQVIESLHRLIFMIDHLGYHKVPEPVMAAPVHA